jgi:phospholipid N-methyltransferase
MMKKSKAEESHRPSRRMEWYFDEVSNEDPHNEASDEKKVKLKGSLAPHMESFFDEITENVTVRCPITMRNANLEAVRSALRQNSPFVDIVYCSIFGCTPSCEKECLGAINHIKHFS